MRKHLMFFVGILMLFSQAKGAVTPIYLVIKDSTIISYITHVGKPVFTIGALNTLVDQYVVTDFQKINPTSRFIMTRSVYRMNVSSTTLPQTLVGSYPQYFPGWEPEDPSSTVLYYTPNDYANKPGLRNTDYLNYIRATVAWDVSKGNPNIVIGIHDVGLDSTHPDLINKIARKENANYLYTTNHMGHGTHTSGLIASETDNNILPLFAPYGYYPSIGFNCKLDYVGCTGLNIIGDVYQTCPGFLLTSQRNRRIISLSVGSNPGSPNLYQTSNLFIQREIDHQEMYENGTLVVAAAGNGVGSSLTNNRVYAYPSSVDYVFSVSGVGWKNAYGMGYTSNIRGVHQRDVGDTVNNIYQHNTRVDLLAPAFDIGGLGFNGTQHDGTGKSGTSVAAPLVSGTAGLILSYDSCYTPYQLEYILKKSSDTTILALPENLPFAGKIGAGALDAGNALAMAGTSSPVSTIRGVAKTSCNDPLTTTMYIRGVELNTVCSPQYTSNGVKPKLTPIIRNGTPPYTARWEPLGWQNNVAILNSNTAFSPEIISAPMQGTGTSSFRFRLTVYDNSPVQKVASRIVAITLQTGNLSNKRYDLASRDSYMDMLDEPNSMTLVDNRESQYYISPDIWNRRSYIIDTAHQNPEYNSILADSNHAYVRVRNVGCSTYSAATAFSPNYLHLYWTVASTGENWPNDWNGTTLVGGQPGGGEITTGLGVPIPDLEPGEDTMMIINWRPVKPSDYGFTGLNNDGLNVCLLSRITPTAIPDSSGPIIKNVRNNNNIATRNLYVYDMYMGKPKIKTRSFIATADAETGRFDLQFINDKEINRHFSGNFSAIGKATLYLGALYDVWINAGGQGHYLSRNADTKTVVFDGSTTLDLLNVPLTAGVKYPVDIEFELYNVPIPNYEYNFHLRQFKNIDGQRSNDIYGSMTFQVNTSSLVPTRWSIPKDEATAASKTNFSIHPNPVSDKLAVSYLSDEEKNVDIVVYDITGRMMLVKSNQHFQNSFVELNVAEFVPGVYFINITNGNGVNERFKFIKQ